MDMEPVELAYRLDSIFSPTARARRDKFYNKQSYAKFVHYTSAEAALSIIKTKRLWMRSTTCMSDYREVQHGYDLLDRFFRNEANKNSFFSALDACSSNVAQEALVLFSQWWGDIQYNTYIASISEHDDKEDLHGRLSMWRAFGGASARVAIVLSVPWLTGVNHGLNILFSPVAYFKEDDVYAEINAVINNVHQNREFLCTVDRTTLLACVFHMFVAGVTCLKHEGFHEEREWRVLYAPKRWNSTLIKHEIEVIGSIPQVVYKLPLDGAISDSLAGLDIARIFDRLIIGPSQFSWAQREAFVDALLTAGVADAEQRVVASGIPIRT